MAKSDAHDDKSPDPTTEHPESTGTGSPPYRGEPYEDVLTFRDIVLFFQRAYPLIAIFAVVAAVLAIVVLQVRAPSYEATSSVIVSTAPVRSTAAAGEAGLTFDGPQPLGASSYRRIANSDAVLQDVIDTTPGLTFDSELDVERYETLRDKLTTSHDEEAGGDDRLVMDHIASDHDPALAAALADAWAEATLAAVQATFADTLGTVASTTTREVDARRERLHELEAELEAFRAQDERALLEAREGRLVQSLADSELRLDELDRSITIATARRDVLSDQLDDVINSTTTTDPTSDGFLAGLTLEEAEDVVANQLRVARDRADAARSDLLAFDREYDLALLEGRISNTRSAVQNGERRLSQIEIELAVAERAIESLAGRATDVPDRLRLRESLGAGDGLALGALSADPDLLTLELQREILNPLASTLENELASRTTTVATLDAERAALARALEDQRRMLDEDRQALADLERQRAELARTFDQTDVRLANLLERDATLNYAVLDPRTGDRVLRSVNPDVVALQRQFRDVDLELAALTTEREVLDRQLNAYTLSLEDVRQQLARLENIRTNLQRDVQSARASYQSVVELEPTINYLSQLTSSGVRMLNHASIPVQPTGLGTLQSALLAAIMGAFVGGFVALAREATREEPTIDAGRTVPASQAG